MKFTVGRSKWYRGKDRHRERLLTEIFARNGDEVVFVDSVPESNS